MTNYPESNAKWNVHVENESQQVAASVSYLFLSGFVYFSHQRGLRDGVSLAPYLALYGSHPHRLHVHSLVSQPQACAHMLYVADRVSVLDLRGSHAINFFSHPCIQFFLRREEKERSKFLKYAFFLKERCLVVNMFLEKFSPLKSPKIMV